MEEQTYSFASIRGFQAGREYYVIMCPFKLIPKIFLFDEEELSPELRAQRTLNKARIPEMTRYITENPNDYCFSAITASIDGDIEFVPLSEDTLGRNVGKLLVGMSCNFIINDGQHRRAAIEEALKVNHLLANEKICVVLFVDRGLKRCQQMFADLNKHAVRPSGSLGVLYDHRDPLAELTKKVVQSVPVFKDMIELEKTSISNRSRKLFTLNSLYQANKVLLGKKKIIKIIDAEENICIEFWNHASSQFPDWGNVKNNKINPDEFRKDYVHAHGILLQALGVVGNSLLSTYKDNWKNKINKLKKIDWSRKNTALWEGKAMVGGRMSASPINLLLTSSVLKHQLGVELTPEELRIEKQLQKRSSK